MVIAKEWASRSGKIEFSRNEQYDCTWVDPVANNLQFRTTRRRSDTSKRQLWTGPKESCQRRAWEYHPGHVQLNQHFPIRVSTSLEPILILKPLTGGVLSRGACTP